LKEEVSVCMCMCVWWLEWMGGQVCERSKQALKAKVSVLCMCVCGE
jgi:hypothetical protein